MTTAGLALVGFMTEPFALAYLSQRCVPADPTPGALRACWEEARARVGGPLPNAGKPEIAPIPAGHAGNLKGVAAMPRFAESFPGPDWDFRMVEIP